ncbi:MAG: hypothetical protein IT162_17835 [Bryobacterales bacterium]|nr:hypothetical protein [Bryobacterales bacterium]
MQTKLLFSVLAGLAMLGACGGSSTSTQLSSKDAVRQAIVDHLSARKGLDLDMSAMDVLVDDASFKADEAEATVSFRAKGSQTTAMTMKYSLVRDGAKWKVKPRAAGEPGAGAHGAGAMPGAAPGAMPGAGGAAPELPPNHPPMPKGGAKQ